MKLFMDRSVSRAARLRALRQAVNEEIKIIWGRVLPEYVATFGDACSGVARSLKRFYRKAHKLAEYAPSAPGRRT